MDTYLYENQIYGYIDSSHLNKKNLGWESTPRYIIETTALSLVTQQSGSFAGGTVMGMDSSVIFLSGELQAAIGATRWGRGIFVLRVRLTTDVINKSVFIEQL